MRKSVLKRRFHKLSGTLVAFLQLLSAANWSFESRCAWHFSSNFLFFRIFAAVPKLCEVRRLQHISLTPRKSLLAKKRVAICGGESFLRLNAEPTRRNIRAQGLQSCGLYVVFAVCLIQCTSQTSVIPSVRTYSPCTCTHVSVVM